MDDAFGNPLAVGDYVVYGSSGDSSSLFIAQIEKINPKTVTVRIQEGKWNVGGTSVVGPNRVAVASEVKSPEERRADRARFIREALGRPLSDYILGCENNEKLKVVCDTIKSLREKESDSTIQVWFQGMNPALGDRSPAVVIVESDDSPYRLSVLMAQAMSSLE